MLGDEKTRNKLLLAVEVCRLYCMTGASTTNISEVTDISKASVKRYLTCIRDRKEEILKLCPEYKEEELDALEEKVEFLREENIRSNKWAKSEVSFINFPGQLETIAKLKKQADSFVSDAEKVKIKDLRINAEASYRVISNETGVSLSQVYRIAEGKDQKKGSSPKERK